jgi:aldehyde dehydrogenase (NAD+)
MDQTPGEALALHEDVDKISFTGSVARPARKLVARVIGFEPQAPQSRARRKIANIIFPDANSSPAGESFMWGVFANKGEMCTAAFPPAGA